jgi:hypothetical protein
MSRQLVEGREARARAEAVPQRQLLRCLSGGATRKARIRNRQRTPASRAAQRRASLVVSWKGGSTSALAARVRRRGTTTSGIAGSVRSRFRRLSSGGERAPATPRGAAQRPRGSDAGRRAARGAQPPNDVSLQTDVGASCRGSQLPLAPVPSTRRGHAATARARTASRMSTRTAVGGTAPARQRGDVLRPSGSRRTAFAPVQRQLSSPQRRPRPSGARAAAARACARALWQ